MTRNPTDQSRGHAEFRGKISRRLISIMAMLFLLVLAAGGISLYLTYSIYQNTHEVRRERAKTELVDSIHNGVHHYVSDLQRVIIAGARMPTADRRAHIDYLNSLLRLYHLTGGGEKEGEERIPAIIGRVTRLANKFAAQEQNGQPLGPRLNRQDLQELNEVEKLIRETAHRLTLVHRAKMDHLYLQNEGNIELSLRFYGTFAIIGALVVLGAGFYSSRTIAQPLRRLAQSATEISRGNLHKQTPVNSKDEIGLLSHAFSVMVARLTEYQERLKAMATEEERERIGRELHDSLAQDLGLLHVQLTEAERSLSSKKSTKTKERLREMRKVTERAYEDVRQAIFGLRVMVSKGLGLIPTLTEYLHDFSEARKIPVDLRIHGAESIALSLQAEIQLIRIIHEALTNVFKHAQATKGSVEIEHDGQFTKVTIEDDGKGFTVEQVTGKGLHFGLQSMRERAEAVGGNFTIDSAPGKGTRVIVHLPNEGRSYEADPLVASR